MQPELKVQLELDAHEKECAIRYQMVNDKLEGLDKEWTYLKNRNYIIGSRRSCH